jgi:hypothetical protein
VLAAVGALWLGLFVAGARIGNALGWWMVPREALVGAHVQLAAVGFGTLLVMGVGSRLLPMFLLSRTAPEWPRRWSAPLGGAGVLPQAALWFRHRARPQLDPSLRQVIAALTLLGAALAAGVAALVTGRPQFVAMYGLLLIVGWLAVLVAAIHARVVPFLTWMHHYSPRGGEKGLPKVGDLVPVRWVRIGSTCGIVGIAVLVLGVAAGAPLPALVGALLFAGGTLVSLTLYARLALRR